jgi:UDP-glucose 4-epimerase
MKKILITGANSYVGTNVEKWLMKDPYKYYVETLDMKDSNWKEFDFSKFDVVFHVAGIAHVSTKKNMRDLYFKVNRDLVIETAKMAKESGVKQFIFMSSMIVYNSREKNITINTKAKPNNFYGLSKLQAEEGILPFQAEEFDICVLRPPMIYGPGSKGNFPKLIKLAKLTPIFPNICNKRSMLYIDNLAETIKYIINNNLKGIYFPQNNKYSCTSDIVHFFSNKFNDRIWFTRLLNPFVILLSKVSSTFNKLFSDSYYSMEMSKPIIDAIHVSLEESLKVMVQDE